MYYDNLMIEWDEAKRAANLAKHKTDFVIAERFDWETAIVWEDARFDYGETRLVAAGLVNGRLHIMVFTERGETTRVISLRKANDKEVRFYETAKRETG